VIAFTTAYQIPDGSDQLLTTRPTVAAEQVMVGALGLAFIESVEEAIYNSLLMAETVVGRDGNTRHGLPAGAVADIIRQHSIS
jgi:D-aminopeptidase